MSKTLLIVESPAKAKTISKYLGDGFDVIASIGHIRDLPKSNKDAVDIKGGFEPKYVVVAGKEKVVNEIKKKAKTASEVLLAPDPDREGEAIAWHISEAVGLKNPKRVTFHEITKEAIEEAIKHPRKIDTNLKSAQEARRVLDRLFGYDLSGLIWKKLRYGLSAGRVQSPALRILVEREREIKAFISETYWTIEAKCNKKKGASFPLLCEEEPRDRARVDQILEAGKANKWQVANITETNIERSPRAPFTTSTLQQSASSRLGFSPSKTMGIAQKLYESGAITYMRTDSTNLSKTALAQASAVIVKEFGQKYHQFRTYATKSKNAQEAHEAIRPTNLAKKTAGNTPEQKALYNLIWSRTISSQMAGAKLLRTKIIANWGDDKMPNFAINGSRVIFDGWLLADSAARGEDVELPKVSIGDQLNLESIQETEKQTQPPSRYSEAGLVKELEKRGIGRPSTYASIIKTLVDREYVTKENKSLKPTETGEVVSGFLENHFGNYISDSFTAKLEDELDDIARGEGDYVSTLEKFYQPFSKSIASKKDIERINVIEEADPAFKCPICGSSMVVKLGRGGKFLSCSRYPECDGALTIDGQEVKADQPIGNDPETNQPIFVKVGRYGPYVQLGMGGTEVVGKTKTGKDKVKKVKPKMASIPKGKDLSEVSVEDALVYLSLPRKLGEHPETGKTITASIGRFGPYIVLDGDFRSLKGDDSPYTITLERAIEILKEPKKVGRGRFAKKTKADTAKKSTSTKKSKGAGKE